MHAFLLIPLVLAAQTTVVVRAVSRDAKVLHDGVGGARITIRNTQTGEVMASGVQLGSSGDTKRIMTDPRARGAVVYGTEGAAAFRATFDLLTPTPVEIVAEGPLKFPQAIQRASTTMLLVPGQNIEGDGIVLEIPGLIVESFPEAAPRAGKPVSVRAKVTMSCGCPTEPGGIWNADHMTVVARASRDGKVAAEAPLRFAGETSMYAGSLPALAAGTYELEVLATNARTGNAGRHRFRITIDR